MINETEREKARQNVLIIVLLACLAVVVLLIAIGVKG